LNKDVQGNKPASPRCAASGELLQRKPAALGSTKQLVIQHKQTKLRTTAAYFRLSTRVDMQWVTLPQLAPRVCECTP